MEDAQDSTMALTAALQDLEFLVLADSTFQRLLNKDQYGSLTLFGGQALVCPGASLSLGATVVALPAHPRTLSWQSPAVRQPGGDSDAQGQHGQEGQRGSDSPGIVDPGFSPTAL